MSAVHFRLNETPLDEFMCHPCGTDTITYERRLYRSILFVYNFLQTSQSWRECWVVALLCTRYIFTTIRYNKTASAVLHNTMGLISCKSRSLCMDYHYTHLHTRHRSLSHVIKTSWSLKVLVGLLSRNFWSTSWFQFPVFSIFFRIQLCE